MNRLLVGIIAFLSLAMGYAQLNDELAHGNVSQFLEEQEILKNSNKTAALTSSTMIEPRFVAPHMIDGTMMVEAFIGMDNSGVINALRAMGVKVQCVFDDFVTARIPVDLLSRVSELKGVNDVHISGLMDQCTDSTLRATHAGQVLSGPSAGLPQAYNGNGVIIGIIDDGFDYQHEAFRTNDDENRSRIVRVYDPKNNTGHDVMIDSVKLNGSVFMGAQIDTLTMDTSGSHGTHTASIAAGTHVNGYGGMAPGADIVMCSSRSLNSGLNEVEVAECIKYIYAYADSVGKPCVISISLSTNSGAHDGKDYLSKAIESMTGPGRILVMSAGNNATNPLYLHGTASKEKPLNFLIDNNVTQTDNNYFYARDNVKAWCRDQSRLRLKFHILDKRTNRIVWESEPVILSSKFDDSQFSEFFEHDPAVASTGYMQAQVKLNVNSVKFNVLATVYNLKSKSYTIASNGRYISDYRIGVSVFPSTNDTCEVDVWTETSDCRLGSMTSPVYIDSIAEDSSIVTVPYADFYAKPEKSASINSYAVSDSVISAGAYVARNSFYSLNRDSVVLENAKIGSIYFASSYEQAGCGPTGKALPTVTAPGYDVVAAGSRYSYFKTNVIHRDLVMRSDNGSLWGVMTGTSMASPTVAGIIAQWLQIQPDLSVSQIKDLITQTAIKDSYTSISHQFGPNGKIDALAGAVHLINNNPNYVLGDANGDGELTIKDVTYLIDYLLGGEPLVFVSPAGDVSQDGYITIKDVTAMIDLLLSSPVRDECLW